ncbi:MAG: IS200/IS605 family transposase [Chitinophagaceae bacterium]
MSSYRQIYYHIIFGTKNRESTIAPSHEDELYKYISGIIKNHQCKLYRINGMPDHIHIFTDLHPSVCLSDLVKNIKVASSIWLKANGNFPSFTGWQEGYGAFTYAEKDSNMIINYIRNQKEHHRTENFFEEYKRLLAEQKIEFDEKYLL